MKRLILLLSLFIFLFVSCSNNVYIDDSIDTPVVKKNIWRVESTYFETADEAVAYIINASQSRSLTQMTNDASRTIVLTRHVLSEDNELGDKYNEYIADESLRGSITIPSSFTGNLTIDFGGYRYDFSNDSKAFFVINGGDNIYIYNGTTVIYNEASHTPYAITVDTETVTIDEHMIDDRRKDNRLLSITENGHLRVENVSETEGGKALEGEIALITDGNKGASLDITSSDMIIDNIYTKYRNADGTISDTIGDSITLTDDAKSKINIESGTVTIKAINKESDYYNSSYESFFDKAVINILGTKDDTTIKSAHEINDTVEKIIVKTGDKAEHVVWHNMTHHQGVATSCIAPGSREYWTCDGTEECKTRYYTKEDGSTYTTDYEKDIKIPQDLNAHTLDHTVAEEATCTKDGNTEYWHCTLCDKYFSDEAATTVITKDSTVIPHHTISTEWEYDIDNHYHVCTVDGNHVDVTAHSWSEWEKRLQGGVEYLYAECSVCHAGKVCKDPDYLVYNLGIGELELENIKATPRGRFFVGGVEVESGSTVTVKSKEVTVVYEPYFDSNTDYKADCYLYNNGQKELTGVKDDSGYYTLTLTLNDKTEHILDIQLKTEGGSSAFECHLYME